MTQLAASRLVRIELAPTLARELSRPSIDAVETNNHEGLDSGRRIAHTLLEDAVHQRATDVHLDPEPVGTRVRVRIDGKLLDAAVLTPEQGARVLRHFKATSGLDSNDRFHPADARRTETVDGRSIDLRIASLPSILGEKLSIRILDRTRVLHRLQQLGFADDQRTAIEQWLLDMSGMFLIAGPTGSGKTTTAYALLHELTLQERSVVTIEDPVEYQVEGITQIQTNRRHGLSFGEGLRAMLRADPDYLFLGEIRDHDAAHAALEASGSGRILMTTIHAPDAVGAVTALRNFGLADPQISSSLHTVIAQRLVRRLCSHCRHPQPLNEEDRKWLASVGLKPTTEQAWAATGCDQCRNLGYHGRIGIFEIWRLSDLDHRAILHSHDERSLRASVNARGLRTLFQDGWCKAEAGITSLAELRALGGAYHASCPT